MLFDIVSDLHVEKWKNSGYEYNWNLKKKNNSVIIAGDVSNNIDTVLDELKVACSCYQNVLYIDGNHEYINNYHDFNTVINKINDGMQDYSNFYYLRKRDFIFENKVIIGANGWWDFRFMEPSVSRFDSMKNFDTTLWGNGISKNVIVRNIVSGAVGDFMNLQYKVKEYCKKYEICIVSHSVPNCSLVKKNNFKCSYLGNSLFQNLFYIKNVKYFIYGHDHSKTGVSICFGKKCFNNARGCYGDSFNRVDYEPLVFNFS